MDDQIPQSNPLDNPEFVVWHSVLMKMLDRESNALPLSAALGAAGEAVEALRRDVKLG